MDTILLLTAVVLSTVFLFAGLGKLRRPADLEQTLDVLFPRWGNRRRLVQWFGVLEMSTGAMIALMPSSRVTLAATLSLGTIFALVGAFAWHAGLDVQCACFGTGSSGRLGLRQVFVWPAWAVLALVAARRTHPVPDWAVLSVSSILAAAVAAAGLTKSVVDSRRQTIAFDGSVGLKRPIFLPTGISTP